MSGTRGSIQRRRPDPRRKPPERKQAFRGGAPMFHDAGRVTIPANGAVTVFQYRFPCVGQVRHASIRLRDVPANADISVSVVVNGESLLSQPWMGGSPIMKLQDALIVDEYTFLSVRLSREGGDESITASADIAYIFQESPSAPVQHPVR